MFLVFVIFQEETLYVESISEFYRSNDIIKYSTITIAALIGIGLLYDLFYGFFIFHSRRNGKNRKDGNNNQGNNKNNNNYLPNNNNKVAETNGTWRNDELNKMRQDIMGIKENITKINTLAKYKNPWYWGEWVYGEGKLNRSATMNKSFGR